LSVSRRARRLCLSGIVTPNANERIGQRIKLHASYELPTNAVKIDMLRLASTRD
jgi:hypothetical protein